MVHSIIKENYSPRYSKDHCFQYDIRLKNFQSDLESAGLTKAEVQNLKVSDFEFRFVPKDEVDTCQKIKDFIIRHEWLGSMPHRPTHRFIATYKGHLAGVIIMATPNAFSNLLGKENRDLEKLISRGACISWSPKNLGSSLIMFSIRWMVKNSSFRFFTAYSDTEARELGTIYQACNFIYLGQSSGARFEYLDTTNEKRGWFSDRIFRKVSSYKSYAKLLDITWEKDWNDRDKILWGNIPDDITTKIKEEAKKFQKACYRRPLPRKHKYLYLYGRTKNESKKLRSLFYKLHPNKIAIPYPKMRGPVKTDNSYDSSGKELTKRPSMCWPSNDKRFLSIKEVCQMYAVSNWVIYQHIKNDPTFPYLNVGLKKKYIIDRVDLGKWMNERTKREKKNEMRIPTAEELLGGRPL